MARAPGSSGRLRRRLAIGAAAVCAAGGALWYGMHSTSWMGPMMANAARAVLGPDAVARLEDLAYAVEDRVNRLRHSGEAPQAYWEVPAPSSPAEALPEAKTATPANVEVLTFRPADVPPVHRSWSAPGDGVWVPIPDPRRPDEPPRLFKTLLHPDRNRSWAAVSIVVVDLRQVDLHLLAGRHEPKATEPVPEGFERKAIIPPEHHGALLGAFNGAFRTEHGKHGMRIDGVTLVRPRPEVCTVAHFDDGSFAITTWTAIAPEEPRMRWWRQTPTCMVEGGKMHPGLTVDGNTHWGATLDRDTVIRRSALGLDATGERLYVGIGDSTTAGAIARAMVHAGAHAVAQLDVNYSYPKFLLYEPREPGAEELVAKPLCKGFEFSEDEFVRKRAPRDFFYLTRRESPKRASTASASPPATAN